MLILTTSGSTTTLRSAGGRRVGVLAEDAEPDEVVAAVRSVGAGAGDGTLAAGPTKRSFCELVSGRQTQPVTAVRASELLVPRELEILLLRAQGRADEDIAGTLVVEVSTLKSHLGLMPQSGSKSRLHSAVCAYQVGVVDTRA